MSPDHLSTTFAALADPTRRAILARLSTGEATVTDLAEPFEMSMPAISKHLKVLERAGLVARSREAQWRPCRIEAAPLKDVAEWVETYRRIWEQRSTGSTTTCASCRRRRRSMAAGNNARARMARRREGKAWDLEAPKRKSQLRALAPSRHRDCESRLD